LLYPTPQVNIPTEKTYAYIDGGWMREHGSKAIKAVFKVEPQFDFNHIVEMLQANRLYYYDCAGEPKKSTETQADFDQRTAAQDALLASVPQADYCRVRLGTLKPGKGKKKGPSQKEVDVQIAVDMLTHAANKRMDRAVLVSGDLDFRPVVQSVSELGVIVVLRYDPKATAEDLINACDIRRPLSIDDWWWFMSDSFRTAYPLPKRTTTWGWPIEYSIILKTGSVGGRKARILQNPEHTKKVCIAYENGNGEEVVLHETEDPVFVYSRYLPALDIEIKWD